MGQQQKRVFDLDERTAKFGEAIIGFAKTIPVTPITSRLIDQLIGAATRVGANYREADDTVSKKGRLEKGFSSSDWRVQERSSRSRLLHPHDPGRPPAIQGTRTALRPVVGQGTEYRISSKES